MPLKDKTIERIYWTIGETAEQLGVNTSLLRYWEKEFGTLRPKRTTKGDRLYTKDDITRIREIQMLLKERGFTIQGAKDQLTRSRRGGADAGDTPVPAAGPVAVERTIPANGYIPEAAINEVVTRLRHVREELLLLREHATARQDGLAEVVA